MNPDSIFRRSAPAVLAALAGALLTVAVPSQADNTPQSLPFSQNWANAALITAANDWSAVPGFVGYRGDDLTTATGTDPQTITNDGTMTPVNTLANQTSPDTQTTGGLGEFDGIANPVVALQGSGTADAPFLLLNLLTTGKQNIVVSFTVRDIDGSTDNAVQPLAFQYRVGNSGSFTNLPAGFTADATAGPSLATLTNRLSITLPAPANDQAVVQVRWMTANAVGNDEWVGIDDITVAGDAIPSSTNPTGIGSAAPATVLPGESSVLAVTVTPGTGPSSTGLAVSADLSSIGGSPTQALLDNGMNGDTNAADNVFTYVATVTLATPVGGKTLPFTVSDAQLRSSVSNITLTVAPPTPPAVTTQPQSQTVWENTNVAFSVTANGTAPLAYQWRFGGSPIGSATNTSLLLSNVTTAQNGGYDVVVTNLYGSTTSLVATLTVMPPIATNIAYLRTLQDNVNWLPTDVTNLYRIEGIVTTHTNVTTAGNAQFYMQDATAGLSVFVSGSTNIRPAAGDLVRVVGPMGQFSGLLELNLVNANPTHSVTILGSGNALPAPRLLQFSDTNNIALTETNLEGSLVVISNQFLDVSTPTFTAGSNVTLTNTLGELFTLRIDSRVTSIIGQTKPAATRAIIGVLAQSDTTAPHTANYQILPTRLEDIVPADPPTISVQPQGGTILTGSTFTVRVTAAPSYATYQWYFNGGVLGGQTASNLTLANVTPANGGDYQVVVSTLAGSITSSVATVTIFTPQTVLSIDIEERAATALVYPGFTPFLIDSNISATAKQTNASVRTIGGITVSLSGSGTDPGYDDRVRATPVDAGAFTQSQLLRDFIFSADTTVNGGLNVGLSSLTPNQVYAVTIWSFDSGSPGNRVSDWTANGTLVKSAYTFNGSTLPTTDAQSQFTFKVAASASGQVTIQGRRNPATASAGGVFLNAVQVATALPDPPTITSQPVGTTISAGDNAQFSVGLGGTAPFSIQWRRNGSPLSGGTNATLVVFSAQAGDAGPYDVVVTNPSGSITSSVAQLIVTPVANITTGLISHWPLNVLGVDTPDAINGYSLNATNMDASNLGPGQCGLAPTFNGTDEYLTRTHTNNADLPVYAASYTVTLWVKGNFVGQGDRRVYAESSTTNNTPLFTIGTDNGATSSVVDIFIRTDANVTPANHRKSSLPAFDGQWHHIAWVDSLGFGRLYVDGVLDTNDFNYARGPMTMNTVALGAIQRATAGSFFNGMIDNVAVWRRALSSNEVVYVRRNGPTLAASLVCPPDTIVYTDPDQNVATHPNIGNPDLSGNCSVTSVTNDAPASFPLGETLVTWTATDQNGNSAPPCVQRVTVLANRSPVAGNNGGATSAGIPARFPFVKLLANDSDPDGDVLTISAVTPSTNGASVTISNQTVIYTPQPGFTGTDRFNYTASDGHGGTAVAMVEVFVASGDFPPLNLVLLTPSPNGYLVRFAGVPGRSYDIQRATNVSGPWTTLVTTVAPLHGIIEYEDTQPPQPAAFYRTLAH